KKQDYRRQKEVCPSVEALDPWPRPRGESICFLPRPECGHRENRRPPRRRCLCCFPLPIGRPLRKATGFQRRPWEQQGRKGRQGCGSAGLTWCVTKFSILTIIGML